jgi:hypothetical protein
MRKFLKVTQAEIVNILSTTLIEWEDRMDMKREVPRLNQCFLCKEWRLEKTFFPIEVPDQAGYIRKMACRGCLDRIEGQGRG